MAELIMGLIGGLGLFVYGMQLMGDGLQKLAGDRMRKVLEVLTTKPWRGALVGTGVTAIIQSSSATTVMMVGFVNAGLMNLQQAISVVMGANIGTTITAQIIAFHIDKYALPAIGIGFALMYVGKRKRHKYLGQTMLGFGILFLGITLLKDAVSPLKESEKVIEFFTTFGKQPILGVLCGAMFTAVIQSSSATVGLVIASASQGILSINSALPIVLGAEIGTCVTAMIASIGTSITARRSAIAHLIFNVLGTIVFFSILPIFTKIVVQTSPNVLRQIANAQTSINVISTVVGLLLIKYFVKLVTFLVPGKEIVIERGPIYLDTHVLSTPSIALGQASKELTRMANLTLEMLNYALEAFLQPKPNLEIIRKNVEQREDAVDNLAAEITRYLSKVSQHSLSPEQSKRLIALMHSVNDIERVGDHAENIVELGEEKYHEKIFFSELALNETKELSSKVLTMYENMIEAFSESDTVKAKETQKYEDEVDDLSRNARNEHMKRLNEGICVPAAGVIFLDLVANLERVADLANNLGYSTIGDLAKI